MKKMIFLLSIILLSSLYIYGQNTFQKFYDLRGNSDQGWSIWADETGYLMGSGSFCYNGIACITFVKTDLNGNKLWDVHTGNFPYTMTNTGSECATKIGDAFYITGYTWNEEKEYDHFIFKLSEEGDSIWLKQYGTTKDELGYVIMGLPDSAFVVGGFGGKLFGDTYAFLTKVDKEGNEVWQKNFEDYTYNGVYSIEKFNNGYIVAISGRNIDEIKNLIIYRMDKNFETLWTRTYQSSIEIPSRFRVRVLPSEEGYIAYLRKDTLINAGDHPSPYMIMRMDTAGNIQWQHVFNDEQLKQIENIRITSDGDIIGVGYLQTFFVEPGWIFRMDVEGNLLWEHLYYSPEEDDDEIARLHDIRESPDGGFAATGTYVNETGDVLLLKLDEDGCMEPGCLNDYEIIVDIEETSPGIYQGIPPVRISPNPASGTAVLSYQLPLGKYPSVYYKLYDVLGREQQSILLSAGQNEHTLDLSALSGGIYFYQLLSGDTKVVLYGGKLVVK